MKGDVGRAALHPNQADAPEAFKRGCWVGGKP